MSRRISPIAKLLINHRKCIFGTTNYICICGEDLPSNSHVRLAEHQAQKIEEFLEGEEVKVVIVNE